MRRWWALAAGIALLIGLYFGIERYRYRFVRSDLDLLHVLPDVPNATRFFGNVAALRHGGYLGLLTGSKAHQDADYARFIGETGFDYTRDLETVAGLAERDGFWLAARGRFDWPRLSGYAKRQGGSCQSSDLCKVRTRDGRRWISLRRVQPDVLAIAVSPNATAAEQIRAGSNVQSPAAGAPVWLEPSHAVLTDPSDLPLPARIFAISLESADRLVLELNAVETDAAFDIDINALFPNGPAADTARQQLERSTRLLRVELSKDGRKPAPDSLEGLLTSGTFEVQGNRLTGSWPVRRELLQALRQ